MISSSPLVIGKDEVEALAALRRKAARKPINSLDVIQLIKTTTGAAKHYQRMKSLSIRLPVAFVVTFSIETNHPCGSIRRMSLSSIVPRRVPTREALWMVAEELGFIGGLSACSAWPEDIGNGDIAINLAQPLNVAAPPSTGKTQ